MIYTSIILSFVCLTHPFTEADNWPEGAATGTQAEAAATEQPAGGHGQGLPQHGVDAPH